MVDSFARWVSLETIAMAGFNYWNVSHTYFRRDNIHNVYLTTIPNTDVNIAIIEIDRRGKDGRVRKEWYFGTFKGKHSGECKTPEELDEYFAKLNSIATRRNRIAGSYLEDAILLAVEEAEQKVG